MLADAGVPKACVLKFAAPSATSAAYRAMFDMSTKDPQLVCHKLVDHEQRRGERRRDARIPCWVPRG